MEQKTDIHLMIEHVESSPIFSEFNKVNPDHYLVHAFATIKGIDTLGPLEFGYYGKDHDKITVFKTEPLAAMPPEEIFKEDGIVEQLDLLDIQIGFSDAARIVKKLYNMSYSHHPVMQSFCVLQHNTSYDAPLWNITVVFGTLHMLNVKINAISGEILLHDLQNIMSISKE